MPETLDDEHRLLAALDAAEPVAGAIRLAKALKAEGMAQLEMYRLFAKVRDQLEDGDPRYDAVLDTMDFIVGFCGPQARLFDTYLSNEQIAPEPDE
jgi:hypothetical protein